VSLLNCFNKMSGSKGRTQKPSLENRLPLSLALAISLGQFHGVGWVHKSVRSENVIFFPRTGGRDEALSPREPWLEGFEYAREDPGLSAPYGNVEIQQDIYRHPEQWGQPTRRFNRIHDIYSLGMVLLEISTWRPALQLEQTGFKNVDQS
jgi:serine/threonine protein kinase